MTMRLALLILLLPTAAFAQTQSLPKSLLYRGKPIEPLCFTLLTSDVPLDVSQCANNEVVIDKLEQRADGAIGRHYQYKDEDYGEGTIFYRYAGSIDGKDVMLIEENSGGSGLFSSVFVVRRQAKELFLDNNIAGGDRCNGGITSMRIEGDIIVTERNVTPYDFLDLAEDIPAGFDAYDQLESSASSCFGVAIYHDNQLQEVSLAETAGDDKDGWTENYSYQSCFNAKFRSYLARGKNRLSVDELKEFVHSFNTECIKPEDTRLIPELPENLPPAL